MALPDCSAAKNDEIPAVHTNNVMHTLGQSGNRAVGNHVDAVHRVQTAVYTEKLLIQGMTPCSYTKKGRQKEVGFGCNVCSASPVLIGSCCQCCARLWAFLSIRGEHQFRPFIGHQVQNLDTLLQSQSRTLSAEQVCLHHQSAVYTCNLGMPCRVHVELKLHSQIFVKHMSGNMCQKAHQHFSMGCSLPCRSN